ncbi:MAG TPA: Asp-tRNA(Asn)/Glu-tRNA(Gln) amidotransferase subunit GatC [Solirubrobacteraceae bacterium]|nr:Asp-tRNA(Asn)/Glu-tRNA(Gln) amidotransferase subunit GatC [Solirubrobacteraceae bacterium]
MTLERAQVLHVAKLAKLELDETEVERMGEELSKVLDHVDRIRELNLDGVPPTSHAVDLAGVMRADEPQPCLDRDVILAAAPEPVDGGFGVPSPGPGDD